MPELSEHIIEQVRDHAIFLVDTTGRIASWNQGVANIFGYAEAEWIGQPASIFFLPEDVARGIPDMELRDAASTGRASDDRWLRRKNGKPLFGVGTMSRIESPDGQTTGFLKVVRDYTEVQQMQQERTQLLVEKAHGLAEAARQAAAFSTALEAIPDAVYVTDQHIIKRCNAAALTMLGAAEIEELHSNLEEWNIRFRARRMRAGSLLPSADLPLVRALAGHPSSTDLWLTKLDGTDIYVRATAAPVLVDGRVEGAIAIHTDLTEHQRATQQQQALQRAEVVLQSQDQQLKALVEGVREYAIFTVDPQGLISSWHEGAALMKGYTAEEAIGMPFANLFMPDDRAAGRPEHEMEEAARTGEYKGEGHRIKKNGEIFEAAVVLTALRGPNRELLGFLKLTQDITARRAQERAQLESLRNAETARESAERANQSMSEFLATISHELRTPLSSILGWAQLLSREEATPDQTERGLASISRNARVQIGLIEDLLDMNRMETGQLRLEMQELDLGVVITGALESVLPAARAKGLRVQTDMDLASHMVMGDPIRLQQVVWNLLMNGVKFTPKGGTLTVSLKGLGETAEFAIQDTGQGIDTDFLPRVFDRFQQQDASTTRRQGGLGLGLSIVKHLVELHGGRVGVHSDGAGRGATFTVTIPALSQATGLATGDSIFDPESEAMRPGSPRPLEGTSILLVDDEEDVREVSAYILRDAGASVIRASSAMDAIRLMGINGYPDVLISDVAMPDHDGYDLIAWLHGLTLAGRKPPVIAFTAYSTAEDSRRLKAAGFSSHLVKPVGPKALIDAVSVTLGRT